MRIEDVCVRRYFMRQIACKAVLVKSRAKEGEQAAFYRVPPELLGMTTIRRHHWEVLEQLGIANLFIVKKSVYGYGMPSAPKFPRKLGNHTLGASPDVEAPYY